ncbi:MAG: aminoacyl-tRNA hydrolase [candidate division Zixibacteria bacterium]|nr:aminoacyl-tRNA hydrolase [candidate division Zixibacteria bacterium]
MNKSEFDIILGLGNVGAQYEGTRHNVGFEVLKRVRSELKAKGLPDNDLFYSAEKNLGECRLILAWPRTLMNRSGLAAQALLTERAIPPSHMLVVVDDFNLPLGRIRFRRSGSDGGHHGLESLIEVLETEDFPRLRLGTGPKPTGIGSIDFVLSRFSKEELVAAEKMIDKASEAVIFALNNRFDEAMTKFNFDPA